VKASVDLLINIIVTSSICKIIQRAIAWG